MTDAETEVYEAESDSETTSADFTVGGEMFDPSFTPTETTNLSGVDAPFDSGFGTTDTAYSAVPIADTTYESPVDAQIEAYNRETSEAEAAKIAEQEAHTQAATDAQNAADEFIAKGDYAAAAEARETAENESWEAGDDSMLSAYDAGDLTFAADKQEQAEYYNEQQTQFAQAGRLRSGARCRRQIRVCEHPKPILRRAASTTRDKPMPKNTIWTGRFTKKNRRITTPTTRRLTRRTAILKEPKAMPHPPSSIRKEPTITAI
jgi:hypothetical protein